MWFMKKIYFVKNIKIVFDFSHMSLKSLKILNGFMYRTLDGSKCWTHILSDKPWNICNWKQTK